ncbi:ribonuclease P protein component [bacterium]|nr:ribonuclease P protein component [bacterium]
MLKQEYRLKKRSAFAATYRTGKSFHFGGITMVVGKEKENDSPTKYGFVVSKKINKRAVKRNRIKRLMRESMRLIIKEGYIQNKYLSVIFIASSKMLGKTFKETDSDMRGLVAKL